MEYQPVLNLGEFLGHGIGDDGRVYEGYDIDGQVRYFHADDGSEIV